MSQVLPPVSGAAKSVATTLGSQAALSGDKAASTLTMATASAGISLAVSLGVAGVSWLWKKIRKPPPPEAPKRSEIVKSKRTAARFVHGDRFKTAGKLVYRTVVPGKHRTFMTADVSKATAAGVSASDAREYVGKRVGYNFNHYRQIFVVSEGKLSELHAIEMEKHGIIPLGKVTEADNEYYEPADGAGFDLPPADVAIHGFPQKRIVRCWLANEGDGSDLARFVLEARASEQGVLIEYERAGTAGTTWNPTPDPSTRRWRTYTLTCGAGETAGEDGLCYPTDRPGGIPTYNGDPNWNTGTQPSNKQILETGDFDQLPAEWTADHDLKGKTAVVVDLFAPFHQVVDSEGRIDTSDDFFEDIPEIKFLVSGMEITWPGRTTPASTSNPAAIQYWYDTERLGIPASEIDRASFTECYNDCERMIRIPDAAVPANLSELKDGGLNAFKAFQFHGVITSGEEPEDVRDKLAMARDGGTFRTSEGKLEYRAGKIRPPKLNLDRENFTRLGKCKPWQSLDGRVNEIVLSLDQSAWEDYNEATITIEDPHAKARDIRERPEDVRMEGQSNPLQAAWLGNAMLIRERETFWLEGEIGELPGMAQKDLLPGDRIFVSSIPSHGIVNRTFVVEKVVPMHTGRVEVILRLHKFDPYRPTLFPPEPKARGLSPVRNPAPPMAGLAGGGYAIKQPDGTTINHLTATWDAADALFPEIEFRSGSAFGTDPDPAGGIEGSWTGLTPFTVGAPGSGADFTTTQTQRHGIWLNFQWGNLWNDGTVRGSRTSDEARALALQMQRDSDNIPIPIPGWLGPNDRALAVWRFGIFGAGAGNNAGSTIFGADEIDAAGTGIGSAVVTLNAQQQADWRMALQDSSGALLTFDFPTTLEDPDEPYVWNQGVALRTFLQTAKDNNRTVSVLIVDSSVPGLLTALSAVGGIWQPMAVAGSQAEISPVQERLSYDLRGRWITADGRAGAYAEATHFLSGDLTPPGVPTNIRVDGRQGGWRADWTNALDPDISHTECAIVVPVTRSNPEGRLFVASAPGDATFLLVTAAGYRGNFDIVFRHVDRRGNRGAWTAPVRVTALPLGSRNFAIYTGTTAPAADLGQEGDLYIRSNLQLYRKQRPPGQAGQQPTWQVQFSLSRLGSSGWHVITTSYLSTQTPVLGRDGLPITISVGDAVVAPNGNWWEYTGGTTFVYRGNLTGQKGEPGEKGVVGVQGRQGVPGPVGDPGDKGIKGEPGRQGEPGPVGDPGPQGIRGERGRQGESGIVGNKGDMGQKGEKGVRGVQGFQGDQGAKGDEGDKGIKGGTGPVGAVGQKGSSGDSQFVYYTNAPSDTDPSTLVPITRLSDGRWTTSSGYYWYGDATQVPVD